MQLLNKNNELLRLIIVSKFDILKEQTLQQLRITNLSALITVSAIKLEWEAITGHAYQLKKTYVFCYRWFPCYPQPR